MKKTISIILVLMLVLSLSVTAFADTEPTDMTTVTVTKSYKLEGAGSSPAETFTLQQVGDGVVASGDAKSAPALGTITGAQFAAGAATADGTEGKITIALPTYELVGIYEYTLKEVAGTNAGVTYYGKEILLRVTVINDKEGKIRVAAVHTEAKDEAKSDTFENTYSAGSLSVSKTVTGNLGDKTKYFKFTVTLTGDGKSTYAETFAVTGGSNKDNPATAKLGENVFWLKDGETITIANLPYGVTYTVVEDTPADYTLKEKTGDEGTISNAAATAAFTNDKSTEVDTGISLDSIPYIALFVVAVLGMGIVLGKKRFN